MPIPLALTLPKETVHLEITLPREDLVVGPAYPAKRGGLHKPPPPLRKIPRRPFVVHIFAVPDGDATLLSFGCDAKLLAEKALASLASAPAASTLGKVAGSEALREGRMSSGGFVTLRGLLLLTAFGDDSARSPVGRLQTLPHKGENPVFVRGRTEAPFATANAGVFVGSFRLPRSAIEDVLKLAH